MTTWALLAAGGEVGQLLTGPAGWALVAAVTVVGLCALLVAERTSRTRRALVRVDSTAAFARRHRRSPSELRVCAPQTPGRPRPRAPSAR